MEVTFLARSLDVLAGVGSAEERLAALLEMIAETAGAQRAAVLADRGERRVAASVRPDENPRAAETLAAWLDARAPRSRAERAASAPALVSLAMAMAAGSRATTTSAAPVSGAAAPEPMPLPVADAIATLSDAESDDGHVTLDAWPEPVAPEQDTGPMNDDGRFACVTIPTSVTVVLGFDFGDPAAAEGWEHRFPAAYARHAGAAIAMVSDELATERELEMLRAQDVERTRFVSTVAHELRTPLTGLGGYLELILAGNVGDPAVEHEFLERSRDIVASMDELVGDLLELSRLESGSLRLEVDAFSVAEISQRVLSHLTPIALQRSVHLTANLPPRLRAARGDRRRVEQILKNLIGNALKFTPAEGSVELAGWFDGPVAVLAVRDDGMGISPDDRLRIFERFFRMASHERINGTGLGLPIARELARAMGGDLEVASVPRAGSSFVLVLPGPTPVEAVTIAETLDRTLAAEESRLEDQGMLRRLQVLGREAAALRAAPATSNMHRAGSGRSPASGERPRTRPRPAPQPLHGQRPARLRLLGPDSSAS